LRLNGIVPFLFKSVRVQQDSEVAELITDQSSSSDLKNLESGKGKAASGSRRGARVLEEGLVYNPEDEMVRRP
jgi:hypothetical protein